jgi:polyisoprenoid-binding protein YceI
MAAETEAPAATAIPGGTWTVDPVDSVAGFSVRHMMVGTFRGEFSEIDATLTDGKLVGKVKVGSLQIKDERLRGHLFSPAAHEAFADDGRLTRGATRRRLREILAELVAEAEARH